MVVAFGLMGVVPLGVLVLFIVGLNRRYGVRFGLLFGIVVAVWGSLCWLVVPYCGGYPNLPGALIGGGAFGTGTWGQEITVHITNVVVWPSFGWLLFRLVGRSRTERTAQDHGTGLHTSP
jgi:hypothetical protein